MRRGLTELHDEVTALVQNPAGGDEPLGFGVDFALITPYLLAVAGHGVNDAATAELPDRVRSVFRKKTAERRARALGAPDDQARILADAFVASPITRS